MPSRTSIVDCASEEFLAGAGLTEQQHRRVGTRHLAHAIERIPQDWAAPMISLNPWSVCISSRPQTASDFSCVDNRVSSASLRRSARDWLRRSMA